MAKPEATLRDILASLTPGQAWSIAAAAVAIIVGAFVFGVFVETTTGERELLDREKRIAELESTLESRESELETATRVLEVQASLVQELDAKSRFLGQYVTYLRDRSSQSKKIFVDLVCGMWREDQQRRIKLTRAPVGMTSAELLRGVSPDVERVLRQSGVPINHVQRIQRLERASVGRVGPLDIRKPSDEGRRLRGELDRSLQATTIVKVVSFSETERYVLPDEVAATVHLRTDCAP
jgi:hypothetical protein